MSEECHHLRAFRFGTHLVVLDGEITALLTFPVRDLHKVPAHQRPSDVGVVPGLILVRFGHKIDFEALHNSMKLGADVVGLGEGAGRNIVVPCPIAFMKVCMTIFSSVTADNSQSVTHYSDTR